MNYTTPCGLPLCHSLQSIVNLMKDGKARTVQIIAECINDFHRRNLKQLVTYNILISYTPDGKLKSRGMVYKINPEYKPATPTKNAKWCGVPEYLRIDGVIVRGLARQVLEVLNTCDNPLSVEIIGQKVKNKHKGRLDEVIKTLRDAGKIKAVFMHGSESWICGADREYLSKQGDVVEPEPCLSDLKMSINGVITHEIAPGHRRYDCSRLKTKNDTIGCKPAPRGTGFDGDYIVNR